MFILEICKYKVGDKKVKVESNFGGGINDTKVLHIDERFGNEV